eukprot:355982-Chlamydomonas_euryale.AAC.13
MLKAGGRGAFTCMHVRGQGPAEAETVGRVKHVLCKDDPAKVSQKGKREDRPLMYTAETGFSRRNKCMHECTHMHQHACCIILVY